MKGYMFVMLVLACLNVCGQHYDKELKIGDPLPMKGLGGMINYPKDTLKFTDHKPKLTILDFWGTSCKSCVEAWPKMLALQKEFGNEIQIILVNRFEDEKVVKNFITQRNKRTGIDMSLPVSCKDSVLRAAFPRSAVPRYCWIDENGVLASVTNTNQVTSANIRKWIVSGPFQMDQVIDEMIWVKGSDPIFVDGNGGTGRGDAFIWSSSLTKGFRNIVGQVIDYRDSISGYAICVTGSSMLGLYGTAYNNQLDSTNYLKEIHGSRGMVAEERTWFYEYHNGTKNAGPRYNYQLIAGRPMSRRQMQMIMRQDLDRYFGFGVTWEKQKRKCLVITMFDSTKAQRKSQGGYSNYVGDTGAELDGVNVHDMIFLMEQMSFAYDSRPIVNETGFSGLLTGIFFKENCLDIKAFDKGLSKFGMHIKEEVREVDILVLQQKNPN
jgi:thiol-disulfide isomerase/thioredoxin